MKFHFISDNFYAFAFNNVQATELIAFVDYLRRSNLNFIIVSLEKENTITTTNNIKITADISLKDFLKLDLDNSSFYLPGGSGIKNIFLNKDVTEIFKKIFNSNFNYFFAICAAPAYLKKYGYLKDIKITCHPLVKDELFKNNLDNYFSNQNIEVDKNIITAKATGNTIDLSLKAIEILKSINLSEDIKKETHYLSY